MGHHLDWAGSYYGRMRWSHIPDTKPPLPFSIKMPTCVALLELVALGMLKTKFCKVQA